MLSIAPFSYLEFEVQKYKESIKKRKKKKKELRRRNKERCFTCTFEGLELTSVNDPVVFYNVTGTQSFVVIESHNSAQKYFKEGTTGEVP